MLNKLRVSLLLLFNFTLANCFTTLPLDGTWTVKDDEGEYEALPAEVPGGIYSDLMENNVIGDIFYGFNDVDTRWVAKRDWIYERNFTVTEEFLDHDNINIVFDGLDTFSSIRINDQEIGKSENMFVRYIFNVKSILQVGDQNSISVHFKSPISVADELYANQSRNYIVPPECVSALQHGECHVNHIRKMQASYSWDWGPAFPSVGIWKRIYIEAYNSTVVRDITVSTIKNASTNSWDIEVKAYFSGRFAYVNARLLVTLSAKSSNITNVFDLNDLVQNIDGDILKIATLSIPQTAVNLWWPNGYGNSPLYPLNVTFVSASGETSTKVIRIGFRTVKLIQNHIATGLSFYFVVNQIPIYMKGSNLIPLSVLPERGTNRSTVRYLLESAKEVHMNMLRVWGGGVYESDAFYETADELGILIWQDFMFACSMYPVTDAFLSTVRQEINQQVKRLQHHPSIAIWAGNNENEVALRQDWYGTTNFTRYARDYVTLYVDTVKAEALRIDNTRNFVTSSPSNGLQSDEEHYHIAENPYSEVYGDVHYYNDGVDSWNSIIYPVSRFTSEYGYQSLPSVSAILTATNSTGDLHIESDFLVHRQHKLGGYATITFMMDDQLPELQGNNDSTNAGFIYYSQIAQAVAVKVETEYYRSFRSMLNSQGKGFNMGALYWQLNDVWIAPTWSGIDFLGNWKMLHYFAKDFFAPVIVTGYQHADGYFNVYTVSDRITNIMSAKLILSIYQWNSTRPIAEEELVVDIPSGASQVIYTASTDSFLSARGCGEESVAKENCFIYLRIDDSNGTKLTPDNYIFPIRLNRAQLVTPTVTFTVEQVEDSRFFKVSISTNVVTLFVWIESPKIRGRFSENGFVQVENVKDVFFYTEEHTSVSELQSTFRVLNLLSENFV